MKHKLLVIFLLIHSFVLGQNSFELFLHGNELYQQGHYLQAIEKYEEIEQPWYSVLAHIGNAFYKLDNKLDALVYWRKAYEIAPFSESRKLNRSIEMVRSELGLHEYESYQQKIVRHMKAAPLIVWQVLLILLSLLTALVIAYNRYRILRWLMGIAFGAYLGLLGFVYYYDIQQKAIVMINTVVYSGADERLSTHHSLQAGQEIRVLEHRAGWVKINYKSLDGWVRNDTFKLI